MFHVKHYRVCVACGFPTTHGAPYCEPCKTPRATLYVALMLERYGKRPLELHEYRATP